MAERQLCTFRIGDLRVGIDVDRVQEVVADPAVTPVPLTDPAVAGLLNLRGQILTVIDGRARLGLDADGERGRTHVILHGKGEAVSLVVDADDEVVEIDEGALEEVPTTVSDAIRACAVGSHDLDGELLVVLDVDVVLA